MDIDRKWVKSILEGKLGIVKVDEILAKPAIGDNENYGSALFRLVVKYRNNQNLPNEKTVILKMKALKSFSYSPEEEEIIFDNENRIYSEVLVAMERLILEAGEEEILWPRYLGHKKLHLLIEDLSPDGFTTYPKERPLDELHTGVMMRVYGRLHALGRILSQKGLVQLENVRTPFIDGKVQVFPKFYASGVQGLIREMQHWGPEWTDTIPLIKKAGENIWEKLKKLALRTEELGPCVFNHGDCWTNNMLFKYGHDNPIPQHIRLVDFQIGHFNSPAWDLTYFFYNTMLPNDRQEKMDLFLHIYIESMTETLKKYLFKGQIPKFEEIKNAVKDLSYYGFLNVVTIRPLLIASKQEGYHLESEKLLDTTPGGPQCIHKPSFYSSVEIQDILKQEIKQYMLTTNDLIN